jgi:carbon storage regulator CsrA
MLVLDRRLNEGFWIDGRIFVKVLGISKQRIKLGVEAPDDLMIVREELIERANGSPNGHADAVPGDEEETHRPVRR